MISAWRMGVVPLFTVTAMSRCNQSTYEEIKVGSLTSHLSRKTDQSRGNLNPRKTECLLPSSSVWGKRRIEFSGDHVGHSYFHMSFGNGSVVKDTVCGEGVTRAPLFNPLQPVHTAGLPIQPFFILADVDATSRGAFVCRGAVHR